MRTTIRIDDELFRQAKALAARRGTTLQAVVEEGLRTVVGSRRRVRRARVELPVSKRRGGLAPDVDLSRQADVRDLLDADAVREGGLKKLR